MQNLVNILRCSLNPDQSKGAGDILNGIKKIIGFCPNLFNIAVTNELEESVKQAAAIQLKNNINEFWPIDDDPTLYSIHEDDKAYIRSRIVEAVINSPNSTKPILLEVLQTIIRNDYPGRWETLPNEIMTFLVLDNQIYLVSGYLCLFKLIKCYEYKKNNQRSLLNQTMPEFLNVMKNHMEFLFNNPCEISVTIQKHILKVYYTYTHLHLSMEVVSKDVFKFWLDILCAVCTRPVPDEVNIISVENRPSLVWWKCKKWALHALSRFIDRYSNPRSVTKLYLEFSVWFLTCFTEKIIQTLFNICEQYSGGTYIVPRMLTFVIISFEYLIKHSHWWNYVKPHLLTLIKEVLFKLLCHSPQDEELWHTDSVGYCRTFFDILSDPSPAYSAGDLLNEVCSKRKGSLEIVMNFVMEVLNSSEANAIHKDAAFHIIGEVSTVLLRRKNFSFHVESFLVNYVMPVLGAKEGFRRARACWLIGQLAGAEFHNLSSLTSLVERTIDSMIHDPDLPVKIMGTIALSELLIQQPDCVKASIANQLDRLVLQILTLIRETEVDELNDALQSIIQSFTQEMIPIAFDTVSHLKETIVPLFDDSIDDRKQLIIMGILSTVEIICKSMQDHQSLIIHLEPIIVSIIEIIFTKKSYDFYEEAYNLSSSLTKKKISVTMWRILLFLKSVIETDGDEISEMMPLLFNYVTVDKPSLILDPGRIGLVLEICSIVLNMSTISETVEPCAAKLLELILINYRCQVDEYVPRIVELVLTRMARKAEYSELRTMCMLVIIAALYYNCELTMNILTNHNWPGTDKLIFDEFLHRLLEDMDCFFGIHDRKLCIIGFGILLSLPRQQRPASLHQLGMNIMPSLIKIMDRLKDTYINFKAEGDTDDEDDNNKNKNKEREEKGLDKEDNEDEEDEEEEENNRFTDDDNENNQENDLESENDSDDEIPDFTTELEEFKTELDAKELEMSEFVHIYNVLSQLSSTDPDWYNILISSMTEDHKKMLTNITDTAFKNGLKEHEARTSGNIFQNSNL